MKVALVELSSSHDECLYTQVIALRSKQARITMICNQELERRISTYDGVDDFIFVKSKLSFRDTFKLWLKLHQFDKVVFNTATGKAIRRLMLFPFPKSTELIGIAHNTKKLSNSLFQKFISRKIRKYFLLNDYLLDTIVSKPASLQIKTFYPILFPDQTVENTKQNGETWICIPGRIENRRRDYLGLLNALKGVRLPDGLKFIFLGGGAHNHGDGPEIRSKVRELGLDSHFKTWDHFVETKEFHNYLYNSDFIMPLIHPGHVSFDLYTYQITGAFNLAFGLKKPLLMHESFSKYEDFRDTSVFYTIDTLKETITQLNLLPMPKFNLDKWTTDYQLNSYLTLLSN